MPQVAHGKFPVLCESPFVTGLNCESRCFSVFAVYAQVRALKFEHAIVFYLIPFL